MKARSCWVCTSTADVWLPVGDGVCCGDCAEEIATGLHVIPLARSLFHVDNETLKQQVNAVPFDSRVHWRCPACETVVVRRSAADLDAAAAEHRATHDKVEPKATPWLNRDSG